VLNTLKKMEISNIESRKLNLISAIALTDDIDKIAVLEDLFFNSERVNLGSISEYQRSKIEEGLLDVSLGKVLTHKEVMAAVTDKIYAK